MNEEEPYEMFSTVLTSFITQLLARYDTAQYSTARKRVINRMMRHIYSDKMRFYSLLP
jgi:hypothetical protein